MPELVKVLVRDHKRQINQFTSLDGVLRFAETLRAGRTLFIQELWNDGDLEYFNFAWVKTLSRAVCPGCQKRHGVKAVPGWELVRCAKLEEPVKELCPVCAAGERNYESV